LVSPVKPYDGDWLTLNVELCAENARAYLTEDPVDEISTCATNGIGGSMGLEVRASDTGAIAASDFDDFRWQTINGTAQTRSYSYNSLNQLLAITGAESTTYTYDPLGRVSTRVKDGINSVYSYDRLDRLTGMSVGADAHTYTYAGSSWVRKSATTNGITTSYDYDGFACVAETTAGTTTHYGVAGSMPLWETTGGNVLTYAQDGHGNITGHVGALGYVRSSTTTPSAS
jgi:YD repeat-containing protein